MTQGKRTARKLLSLFLTLGMILSMLPMSVWAEGENQSTWSETTLDAITADDTVAITMTTSAGATYVLPADKTSAAPVAKSAAIDGTTLTTDANDYGWTITAVEGGGYHIQNSSGDYLYLINSNNGVRVGNTQAVWNVKDAYLTAADTANATRYMGVYNEQEWRCYTSINNNIKDQTLQFWKLVSAGTPTELEIVDIETALAGSTNDEFKVKGVVTLVDGRNIYVQDATGGICLYFNTAPTDIALGDTVTFTGTRTDYKGLPELKGETYEKSSGMTLTAKGTTIGALTTADICTYVHLTGLEVTEVYDNNGAYTAPNITVKDESGNSIQIYKAVVGKTDGTWDIAVGDVIDFRGAVGINTTTLQLRNTVASEIVVTNASVSVAAPTADPASGAVAAGTAVNFSCTTEGAVISYSVDNGESWTEGTSYTVNEAVTILVKATLNGVDSEVVTFAYTIDSSELPAKGLVTDLDQLTDGSMVVIYSPTEKLGMTSETYQDWYLLAKSVTIEDNLAKNPTADLVWTVNVNEDGTYSFTQGSLKVMLWKNSSNYAELTSNANMSGANGNLTIEKCNTATNTFYLSNGNILKGTQKAYIEIYYKSQVGGQTFCAYFASPSEADYGMQFYLVDEDDIAVPPATPYASPASGGVAAGTEVTFSCATEGAEIWYKIGQGEWTQGSSITVNETLTVQVKAVKDGLESEPATFTYTVQTANNTFGLVKKDSLQAGDEVIIHNGGVNKGVGSAVSGHGLAGVDLSPSANVITTDNSTVVWTVGVNEDGTYTFTQGNLKLTGTVSGTYNNLVTNGEYANWTFEDTSTDGTYYLYLGEMTSNKTNGHLYLDWWSNQSCMSINDYANPGTNTAYIFSVYKRGAEPEQLDLPEGYKEFESGTKVTNLDDMVGKTVVIYSPFSKTAASWVANGDWYLRAVSTTKEYTPELVWTVGKNASGYTFTGATDTTRGLTVWLSEGTTSSGAATTYVELSTDLETYPNDTAWTVQSYNPLHNTYKIYSATQKVNNLNCMIESFLRNDNYVFSGYAPYSSSITEELYGLQFYIVDLDEASETIPDDGTWDGILEKDGQYVAYNEAAEASLALFKEATYSLTAAATTIENERAVPGNGAYVFNVGTTGRYYTFEVNGKYLATNDDEELLFVEPGTDGTIPDTAKWSLVKKTTDGGKTGYIVYNKGAFYRGSNVCIEYYSSVFSGWTYSAKNDLSIYLFNFYKVADGTEVRDGIVQKPSVIFDCDDSRYVEQDYVGSFSLDDLAPSITDIAITYTAGNRTGAVALEDCTVSADGKSYSFTIPADAIDGGEILTSFTIQVNAINSYGISYTGEKTVDIIDEPFFTELTPAPNSQTRDEKKPTISVRIGNVGENPTVTMTVNGQAVEAVFENGILSYTPTKDMADGRVTVVVNATRADGVSGSKSWNFTVGIAAYQLYFGQLHSHTTYSDGSGTLDTALDYIASLPESANVQFVAFTDHSNYFDTTSAANPADALNDKSLMTDASRALWEEYKNKVSAFNASHENLLAIAGFEMTWSGGPGHINTFDSDGLVSRNNASLNNKTGDAGMKLYYETINKGNSLNQFNHPGTTFGNFTDFSYRDDETDNHMFLVEVGNGEGQIGAGGYYPSYEQYIIALDKGWHVAPTNNQDNHKGRWGNANDARDVILTNDFSEQGIYEAIRALRVYAAEDKNLQVNYTVNDEPMGTIFTDENAPEKLNVTVSLFDPDASDSISKVELVVDGGVTAYTWNDATELKAGQLSVELDPEYSYYFVRVTQKDGDLAVTAPVWVGTAAKLGITDIKASAEKVYINEATTLTTTLFNNEEKAATVKSLVYTVNGNEVIGTDTTVRTIPAGSTLAVDFAHTFTKAKLTNVTVTAVVELDGKEYTFTAKVELDVLNRETEDVVTPIADVRTASNPADTGYRFVIEGVVTSNASGFDKDTAFCDCIYVQDETGGICCFPVSGEYKIGDKVHIVGHTDFYQGEPELQVKTIEVIGTDTVEPTEIAAAELNDRTAEGKLVTIKGTVESFEEANGLIQTIMVKDSAGNLARVFIDGYITTGHEVKGCAVGAAVTATGLASYDDTWPDTQYLPRLRIRDRADVVCEAAQGHRIIVENHTNSRASTSIVDDMLYTGDTTFTVTCDLACVVALKTGENTYEVLPCAAEGEPHSFTVTVGSEDVTVAIAIKGDANLDGKINLRDVTMARQAYLESEEDAFTQNAAIQFLVTDIDGNKRINLRDVTKIRQVYLDAPENPFTW